jgi:hypothetical protein
VTDSTEKLSDFSLPDIASRSFSISLSVSDLSAWMVTLKFPLDSLIWIETVPRLAGFNWTSSSLTGAARPALGAFAVVFD